VIDVLEVFGFSFQKNYNQQQINILSNTLAKNFNSDSSIFGINCPACKTNATINETSILKSNISVLNDKVEKMSIEISTLEEALRIESDTSAKYKALISSKSSDSQNSKNINIPFDGISDIFTNINEFLEKQSKQQLEFIDNVNRMKIEFEQGNNDILNIKQFISQLEQKASHQISSTSNTPRLLPPDNKQKQKPIETNNKVFEIYLSKFHPQTTTDDIKQYISNLNTNLVPDSFVIQPLIRSNVAKEKLSFVSFKITTLRKETYDVIMNKDIWSPDFSAEPFIKSSSNMNQQKKISSNTLKTPTNSQNNQRHHITHRNTMDGTLYRTNNRHNKENANQNQNQNDNRGRNKQNFRRQRQTQQTQYENYQQQPNIHPTESLNQNFWQIPAPSQPPITQQSHQSHQLNYNNNNNSINDKTHSYQHQNTNQMAYNPNIYPYQQ